MGRTLKTIWTVAGVVTTVIGFGGIPDAVAQWAEWTNNLAAVVNQELVRTILAVFGSGSLIVMGIASLRAWRSQKAASAPVRLNNAGSQPYTKSWERHTAFTLLEAACLSQGVEPFDRVSIGSKPYPELRRLIEAANSSELKTTGGNPNEPWSRTVSREELIAYYEAEQEFPVFLFPEGEPKKNVEPPATASKAVEVTSETAFDPAARNKNADFNIELEADVIISTTHEKTSFGILVKSLTGSTIYDLSISVTDITNVFKDMKTAPPEGFEYYFPGGILSLKSDGQMRTDIDRPREFNFLWHTNDMCVSHLYLEHDKEGRLPTELLPMGAMTIMFEIELSAPGTREMRQRYNAEFSDAQIQSHGRSGGAESL